MKLIPHCNYSDFLSAVQCCRGDVWFVTAEDDRLNMKSTLCNLIFLSSIAGHPAMTTRDLIVSDPNDLDSLARFLLPSDSDTPSVNG